MLIAEKDVFRALQVSTKSAKLKRTFMEVANTANTAVQQSALGWTTHVARRNIRMILAAEY